MRVAKPEPPPDPQALPPEELLADGSMTVADAVAFSGIRETRLKQKLGRGEIPSFMDGGRRMVPKRGLVLYLARRHLESNR